VVGVLIATQGPIGKALLETANDLLGAQSVGASFISLSDRDDQTEAQERLIAAVDAVGTEEGVLVLVDMFGSTPSTMAMSLLASHKVEVLTGVNLAMVLKALISRHNTSLADLSATVLAYGRRNVTSSATWLSPANQNEGRN